MRQKNIVMMEEHKKGDPKLRHSCYMDVIGKPTVDREKLNNHGEPYQIDDPESEIILEKCKALTLDDFQIKRSKALMYEDNFDLHLVKKYNLDNLQKALGCFLDADDLEYHKMQLSMYKTRTTFFEENNMSKEDAYGCALALSFYTGKYSEEINIGAVSCVLQGNGESVKVSTEKYVPILYYMVKALSVLPFYWGAVVRSIMLLPEEMEKYKVGNIITWLQFSSCTVGNKPAKYFIDRNAYFYIYSLTGRLITPFSNYPKEAEVLLLPYSNFIVLKSYIQNARLNVYMRQVELGIGQRTSLWVDDKALVQDYENKFHMEKVATNQMNQNIHFIPRISTTLGISFLASQYGKRVKNSKMFRIASDMTRPDEENPQEAGAVFVSQVRKLGFQNKILIFTSNEKVAAEYILKHCGENAGDITITQSLTPALKFLSFE